MEKILRGRERAPLIGKVEEEGHVLHLGGQLWGGGSKWKVGTRHIIVLFAFVGETIIIINN